MKKVVGIQVENNPKIKFFLTTESHYKEGTAVIVETEIGLQLGLVSQDVKEYDEKNVSQTMKSIVRTATKKDIEKYKENQKESKEAYCVAKEIAEELNLPMHFIDATYTFDKKQLFISYVADTRIDFRELAKRLAARYRTRIELRQIGVRDKAKKTGGIGPCGLSLCCNQFLEDFVSVSINMAKNQDLALNPTKINGLCGRLLCCLNYEDALYEEFRKKLPTIGATMTTKEGKGKVVSINLLQQSYDVELPNKVIVTERV